MGTPCGTPPLGDPLCVHHPPSPPSPWPPQLQDEAVLRLLVAEARGHLRGGRWPLPPQEAVELGGLQCRLHLGPFQPGQHSAESLR